MTSTKIFTNEFQKKVRSAYKVLNGLNRKSTQQIIHFLKEKPNVSAVTIALELNMAPVFVIENLKSLKDAKMLKIHEKEDQAFFSLNHDRLARIAVIVKGLARI